MMPNKSNPYATHEFDSMGRPKPRNEEEARRYAADESNRHRIMQIRAQQEKLLQLQQMKAEHDKLVARRMEMLGEIGGNQGGEEIDYLGEMDKKVALGRERGGFFGGGGNNTNIPRSNIPKSMKAIEEKYEQKKAEAEARMKTLGIKAAGGTKNDDDDAVDSADDDTTAIAKATVKQKDIKPVQTNLVATLSETRSAGEVKMHYDKVVEQWHKAFPTLFVPKMSIKISPDENRPFSSMVIGNECRLTPLTLGLTPRSLRKLFIQLTPDFMESEQRLIDCTDAMYFTPQRLEFVLAKALSEASSLCNGGQNQPWTWVKLKLYKLCKLRKRYTSLRERIEMKSDTMAAHISASAAIGGIEHLAKLNNYYEYYQREIGLDDDAVIADVRLMNIINITENVHKIKKSDAVRLALNNRITLSGDSTNIVNTVNRSFDSQLLRAHIARNYPKTIQYVSSEDI